MSDTPGGSRPAHPKSRAHEDPRFHTCELLKRFSVEEVFFKKKMKFIAELFYYFLDRLDDLCYEIDDWRRESSPVDRRCVMVVLGFVLGLIFLSGCTLPAGTRKVTAWGVGVVPTGSGFPVPFAGYWHSEHGDDVISEQSARPSLPSVSTSTPAGLDEWMCIPDGQILHCGSYDAWTRFQEEQAKKNGL
jgi:hypothetical protein